MGQTIWNLVHGENKNVRFRMFRKNISGWVEMFVGAKNKMGRGLVSYLGLGDYKIQKSLSVGQ